MPDAPIVDFHCDLPPAFDLQSMKNISGVTPPYPSYMFGIYLLTKRLPRAFEGILAMLSLLSFWQISNLAKHDLGQNLYIIKYGEKK